MRAGIPELAAEPFDFQPRTRIIFGVGSLARLGAVAASLQGRRVLLVSDPGLVSAGHVGAARAVLQEAGLRAHVFDGVVENPTDENVAAGVAAARAADADLLVGLGGGSAMDCAKAVGLILGNGGRIADYRGVGKVPQPLLPVIAVPTTAGTGSEVQSGALISDAATHQKMLILDPHLAPRVALLDPRLTVTLPPRVTALTGIDAIAHAVESYVSTSATALSRLLAAAAWRRLAPGLRPVLERPGDLELRADMLLGAALAGLAIENSMLGAAHACANPLTGRYGVAHGAAVALMLPHVVRFNGEDSVVGARYQELAAAGPPIAHRLADHLAALAAGVGLPLRLREHGVEESRLADLAGEAAGQYTARFNPRPVGAAEFLALYRRAY